MFLANYARQNSIVPRKNFIDTKQKQTFNYKNMKKTINKKFKEYLHWDPDRRLDDVVVRPFSRIWGHG